MTGNVACATTSVRLGYGRSAARPTDACSRRSRQVGRIGVKGERLAAVGGDSGGDGPALVMIAFGDHRDRTRHVASVGRGHFLFSCDRT
jgi:hypothetical protein